jgi:murein DD-endopeptidase MepM/ murein hydrolase activator NlpD
MKGKMNEGQDGNASAVENPDPEVMGAFFPGKASGEAMEKRGFLATGLEAIYPDKYECPKATSLFASPLRSDGSRRSTRFFEGLHGGLDIPQPEGTPLLAVADGEIIVKHEGEAGGIGGLGIWVRHAPEDTGMEKYIFVEYKHLAKLPDLAVGDRVKMGQAIAITGNTGTAGGHYGSGGFYHLHMTAYWSDKPDFRFKRVMIPTDGQWLDPLALMRRGPLASHAARDLSRDQKKVRIPYQTPDGRVFPEGTRIIWPYACKPI